MRRYERPVREFLVVLLNDTEKARDLAQDFFAKLSSPSGMLQHVDREKGPFRKYLQQALRNLVTDYHRHSRKHAHVTHLDETHPGSGEIPELAELPSAEAAFHHEWVKMTLAEALTRVRSYCVERNQAAHFELFAGRYLCDGNQAPSWSELGARYGMDQRTARERADTVVRQFRKVLRNMLRSEIIMKEGTAVTEGAIDEEIKMLLSPLKD